MEIAIIVVLIIIVIISNVVAFNYRDLWKRDKKLLEQTKKHYSTVLADQNDTISEKLSKDGYCPLGGGKCWRSNVCKA